MGFQVAWVRHLGAERSEYEAFVTSSEGGHFAQTPAWDAVARTIRPLATRYLLVRRAGQLIGAARIARTTLAGVPLPVADVDRGPVVADPKDLPDVLSALVRTSRRHAIARVKVMPYWAGPSGALATRILATHRFRDAQGVDGSHVRTLRMDLAAADPFAGVDCAALRRKIRQAERAGATGRQVGEEGIDPLHSLHESMMRSQERRGRSRLYFHALYTEFVARGTGAFFVTEHEGQILAALFVLRHGAVVTFVVGASAQTERRFSKTTPAMVAAIRWAKAQGARVFDLGGIPMEGDRDSKRAAIAQFKFDFAKVPVDLAHEHSRFVHWGAS